MTNPFYLIQRAREFAERKKHNVAVEFYEKAIALLEQNLDGSDKSKMELWSTKSELLNFQAGFKKSEETWESARDRAIDSLRYLYKCSKLNEEYFQKFSPSIKQVIKQIISQYGCIFPEDGENVVITCPIYLKHHGSLLDKPTSIAFTYEKAECSICHLDLLDETCFHEVGETYDGQFCSGFYTGMKIDHLAVVNKPKDPNAISTSRVYAKETFYKNFDKEELKRAQKLNLPINCHACRDTNHDPVEISLEKFFSMQGLNIEFD